MFRPWLTLSLDSLIAAMVLARVVRPRHYAPLAALFGVCDLAASSLAPVLEGRLPPSTGLIAWALLLWGALILFDRRPVERAWESPGAVWLLPPLLALDNLLVPGAAPALAGAVSCAMAAVGFALGGAMQCAPMRRRLASPSHDRLWLGASLVVVGLLLAV